MRFEIADSRNVNRSDQSSKAEDFEDDQLNKRLFSVLNDISSTQYNKAEHMKRIDNI